jgi:formamidopyrimidine-DNA glycosylase
MPELPEVENIAISLRPILEDRTVQQITCRAPQILKGPGAQHWSVFLKTLGHQHITTVTRRAKRLIIGFQNEQAMIFQLGMTGKFLLHDKQEAAQKHAHLQFALDGSRDVHFIDARRFGRVWLFDRLNPQNPDVDMLSAGMGPLGPDAPSISRKAFLAILATARPIKPLLLDQSRIAGLGNIYVDESLFAAGIHPITPTNTRGLEQAIALHKHIKAILKRAIRYGGTTIMDFANPYGDMGRFHKRLKVYGRHGQPCTVCKTTIERIVLTGRGTHLCPVCQSPYSNTAGDSGPERKPHCI